MSIPEQLAIEVSAEGEAVAIDLRTAHMATRVMIERETAAALAEALMRAAVPEAIQAEAGHEE